MNTSSIASSLIFGYSFNRSPTLSLDLEKSQGPEIYAHNFHIAFKMTGILDYRDPITSRHMQYWNWSLLSAVIARDILYTKHTTHWSAGPTHWLYTSEVNSQPKPHITPMLALHQNLA